MHTNHIKDLPILPEYALELINFRQKEQLSIKQAATAINVHRTSWANWEIGKYPPSLNSCHKLIKVFNLDLFPLLINYKQKKSRRGLLSYVENILIISSCCVLVALLFQLLKITYKILSL